MAWTRLLYIPTAFKTATFFQCSAEKKDKEACLHIDNPEHGRALVSSHRPIKICGVWERVVEALVVHKAAVVFI